MKHWTVFTNIKWMLRPDDEHQDWCSSRFRSFNDSDSSFIIFKTFWLTRCFDLSWAVGISQFQFHEEPSQNQNQSRALSFELEPRFHVSGLWNIWTCSQISAWIREVPPGELLDVCFDPSGLGPSSLWGLHSTGSSCRRSDIRPICWTTPSWTWVCWTQNQDPISVTSSLQRKLFSCSSGPSPFTFSPRMHWGMSAMTSWWIPLSWYHLLSERSAVWTLFTTNVEAAAPSCFSSEDVCKNLKLWLFYG